MIQRTPPQKVRDERAWPVRVRFLLPDGTVERFRTLRRLDEWLATSFGLAGFAQAPTVSLLGDAAALYFRCVEDAAATFAAFPQLVLADDTMSSVYTSPRVPTAGRGEELTVCNVYSMTRSQEAIPGTPSQETVRIRLCSGIGVLRCRAGVGISIPAG